MDIVRKVFITALLVMFATGLLGFIGDMTEKEKLCRIAKIAFAIEVLLIIISSVIFIWI